MGYRLTEDLSDLICALATATTVVKWFEYSSTALRYGLETFYDRPRSKITVLPYRPSSFRFGWGWVRMIQNGLWLSVLSVENLIKKNLLCTGGIEPYTRNENGLLFLFKTTR